MQNSGLILVGVVSVAAIAYSATAAIKPNYDPVNTQAADAVFCLDYDPPNTADFIMYKDAKYNLIKINAGISTEKVNLDMEQVGEYNGKQMYIAPRNNYFGEPLGENFVYVDSTKKNGDMWLFNIYFKEGETIPNFVRNCTSKGGDKQQIDYWEDSQFPPAAFNSTEVQNGAVLKEPGYLYTDIVSTFNELSQRENVQPAGSLYVQSRNQEYPLYVHLGTAYLVDGNDVYEYIPTKNPIQFTSEARDNLQLKWFFLVDTPVYGWFTPDCKPAIYLYPEQEQQTNVIVEPKGEFTLTIPEYPVGGWDVVASPDGTITSNGEEFPYLYYEAKIEDASFDKPTKGYVASYSELPGLYASILPKLGLNAKETADFKEYWEKYLPYSPYYFVGVMPVETVDAIEPLSISPEPDSTIRVRVFFEAVPNRIVVDEPEITTPVRDGYVAVEWGGMVKLHKDSNFTCSQ